MNDKSLRTFFRRCAKLDTVLRTGDDFILVSFNPASTGAMRGFRIEQQRVPYQRSAAAIAVTSAGVTIETTNVRRLSIAVQGRRHHLDSYFFARVLQRRRRCAAWSTLVQHLVDTWC